MSVTPQPSAHLLQTAAMLQTGFTTKVMPYFRNLNAGDVETKAQKIFADGSSEIDPVTAADKGMERYVIDYLAIHQPDAILIGEETFSENPDSLENLRFGKKLVLDPVDGTKPFCSGEVGFGVLFSEQMDGVTTAGYILRTYETSDGRIDYDLIIGDRESGVWHSPGAGQSFAKVIPFADRPQTVQEAPRVMVSTRYFEKGLLKKENDLYAKLVKAGDRLDASLLGLDLEELGSAVNMWSDIVLGKKEAVVTAPSSPWDQNAGAFFVSLLGGVVKSMDTGTDYVPWRYDGGVIAAINAQMLERVQTALFVTGTAPFNREPLYLKPAA